jgi:hypothetical protein
VTVPVRRRSAGIEVTGAGGPWLPSQTWPATVGGADPLVAERHGTLLLPGSGGATRYTLSWWQPRIDVATLADAAIDARAPGGLGGVGAVPDGIADLARQAVRDIRPSFRTALVLEEFFRTNYRLAVGQDLPTGHAWPQLADFLLSSRRGTSEQFAAAYVALARIRGIPARMAVGFRTPARPDPDGSYTVRNGDVLAWPEVAVRGVGWVPLDPGGAPATVAPTGTGLAAVAARVREGLPASRDLRDPPLAPRDRSGSGGGSGARRSVPWLVLLAVPVVALVAWPLGVPALWTARCLRRRRRRGPGAVVGAWEEVRDRLRAHGVAVSPAMTLRDLGVAAAAVTDQDTVVGIRRLGDTVDRTLWSGTGVDERRAAQAWAAVREVRRGLRRRGWRARLRAALDVRALLPPR